MHLCARNSSFWSNFGCDELITSNIQYRYAVCVCISQTCIWVNSARIWIMAVESLKSSQIIVVIIYIIYIYWIWFLITVDCRVCHDMVCVRTHLVGYIKFCILIIDGCACSFAEATFRVCFTRHRAVSQQQLENARMEIGAERLPSFKIWDVWRMAMFTLPWCMRLAERREMCTGSY